MLAIAFATALCVVTAQAGPKPAARGAAPPAASSVAPAVVMTGWSQAIQTPFGGTLRVGLTVENAGTTSIRTVHVVGFGVTGLELAGHCWIAGQPTCDASDRSTPVVDVAAGTSQVFAGDVTATIDAGKFQPIGLVEWTDAANALHRTAVAFPVIEVAEPDTFPPGWLVFWATGLGFPAVVALVGYLVSRHQKHKEAAAQRRADAAAEAEQKRASRRIEEMSVWRLMLRGSHRDAERHYMPIASAAREFLDAMDDVAKGVTRPYDVREYAALRLVLLHHAMYDMAVKIGGFYFKHRGGEKLAAALWGLFVRFGMRVHLKEDDYTLLRSKVTDGLRSLREAVKQPPEKTALASLNASLTTWQTAGFGPFDAMVHALRVIVKYESNRPHEIWYREVDRFPNGDLASDAAAMAQAATAPGTPADLANSLSQVASDLSAYATHEAAAADERAKMYQQEGT